MASETVRIKPETHAKLRAIADDTGQTMPEVLEQAVELLRRRRLLDSQVRYGYVAICVR